MGGGGVKTYFLFFWGAKQNLGVRSILDSISSSIFCSILDLILGSILGSIYLGLFVQRLRSKPWTYRSKVFLSVFFHSVSDFLGISLVKAMVSDSDSYITLT